MKNMNYYLALICSQIWIAAGILTNAQTELVWIFATIMAVAWLIFAVVASTKEEKL